MKTVINNLKDSLQQTEAHANHLRNRIQASKLDIQQAGQYLLANERHIKALRNAMLDIQQAGQYLFADKQHANHLRNAIAVLEADAHSPAACVAEIPNPAQ